MKIIDPNKAKLKKEEALELYKLYINSEMALLAANGDERIPLETKLKMVNLFDKAVSSYAEYIEGLN